MSRETRSQETKGRPWARPTIHDVARQAGVSKSLVSLVIRGEQSVSEKSRQAVLAAAARLNYRPNVMARSLVQQRTRILGVMIADLKNPFFGDMVSGIQSRARESGYTVLLSTTDYEERREETAIESLLELQVDGLILAGPRIEEGSIAGSGSSVPVVVLNRRTTADNCDSVTNDDESGAQLAVEHCASLGHRAIAHIDGGRGAGAAERRRGYRRAMRSLGLGDRVSVVGGAFTEAGGYEGARKLLNRRRRPSAIFAANDLCAIGALNAIEEAGLSIPDDISLIGYDNTSLAQLRHVSLTTIDQPAAQIGSMGVDLLLERLENRRTETRHDVVQPTLIVRKTTAPPRQENLA